MDIASMGTKALGQLTRLDDGKPTKGALPGASAGEVMSTFGNLLKDQLKEVNTLQQTATEAKETFAVGGQIELHQVMIASQKAELAMELTMQVRNKMIQAYQEISHMAI